MVNPHLLSSEELFSKKGWRLTVDTAGLPDGRTKSMVRVHHHDRVHILAFPTDQTVLVLREYRPMYGTYVWMLPTGGVDKEDDPHLAAGRELREETGFAAKVITPFGSSRHAEGIDVVCRYFLAHELRKDPLPQDDTELMECHELSLEEAAERILTSPVVHTPSAYFILKYIREQRK
jgi:ADP-ribose pyrophosphatase